MGTREIGKLIFGPFGCDGMWAVSGPPAVCQGLQWFGRYSDERGVWPAASCHRSERKWSTCVLRKPRKPFEMFLISVMWSTHDFSLAHKMPRRLETLIFISEINFVNYMEQLLLLLIRFSIIELCINPCAWAIFPCITKRRGIKLKEKLDKKIIEL